MNIAEQIARMNPARLEEYKRDLRNDLPKLSHKVISQLESIPQLSDIFGQVEQKREEVKPFQSIPEAPAWKQGLHWLTSPLQWAQENVMEPFGAIVTSPFTPSVEGTENLPWFQREMKEYKEWEEPTWHTPWGGEFRPTKGIVESLPWFAIPGIGAVGKAGQAGIGAVGKAGQAGRGIAGALGRLGKSGRVAGKVLEYTPYGLAEKGLGKAVGAAGKGAKAVLGKSRFIPQQAGELFSVPANETLEKVVTKDDWMRRVAQFFGRKPVFKEITEAVGGKAATLKAPTAQGGQVAQEVTARALIVGEVVKGTVEKSGVIAKSQLHTIHPNTIKLFGVDEATANALIKTKPGFEGASKVIYDIFEHPDRYVLNKTQSAYIKEYHNVEDLILNALKREGVDVKEIKVDEFGHWVHRVVTGKTIDGKFVEIKKGFGRIGSKQDWEKVRFYEYAADAMEKGINYSPDMVSVLDLYINSAAKKIADVRIAKMTSGLGKTALERLAKSHPGLKEVYDAARNKARFLTGGATTLTKEGTRIVKKEAGVNSILARMKRGEVIPEQTLAKVERNFPEIGSKLRQAMNISMPEFERSIAGISDEAFKLAKITRKEFKDALEMVRMERAGKLPLGEKIVTGGRDITPDELTATLAKLNVEKQQSNKMLKQIYKNTYKAEKAEYQAVLAERQSLLNDIHLAIKAEIPKVRAEFRGIENTYRKAYEIAKTPSLGLEATIQHPAFQGKIYPKEVKDVINDFWADRGFGGFQKVATMSSTMRTMVAAADFSAMFIQGLPGIALHPASWAKGAAMSFKAFLNPKTYQRYLTKELTNIQERIYYGGYAGGFEYMEAMGMLQKMARKVAGKPGQQAIRQSYGRFEAAFGSFGDIARNEMWKAMKGSVKNADELFELARHLDRMTGVMSMKALGIGKTQRDFETGFLFFAPRYTRAGFALVGDMMKGGLTGHEARKALGSLMAAGAAFYTGTCKSLGQEPNFDPTTGRFMTIEINDPLTGVKRHIGIGGMMTSLIRFGADVVATTRNNPMDLIMPMKDNQLNRFDNPFIRFMYGKSAPVTGFVTGMVEGKNYFGEPFETTGDYARFLAEQVTPIFAQELLEEGGISPTGIAAEQLGLRTFPQSDWEKRNVLRDEMAQKVYGMNWEELGKDRGKLYQLQLERDYPELKEATERAEESSSKMARGEGKVWTSWRRDTKAIEEYYQNQVTLASEEFKKNLDGYTFRNKVDDANSNRRAMYANIKNNPSYAEVYEYFEEPPKKELNPRDVARQAYYKMTFGSDMYDEYGNYNFEEADKRDRQFVQQYGQGAVDYIEEYKGVKWDKPASLIALEEARATLQPYWDIESKTWAQHPELKPMADEIKALEKTDPDKAKRMLKAYPQILYIRLRIAEMKKAMKSRNPDIDQALKLFY